MSIQKARCVSAGFNRFQYLLLILIIAYASSIGISLNFTFDTSRENLLNFIFFQSKKKKFDGYLGYYAMYANLLDEIAFFSVEYTNVQQLDF